MDYSLPFIPVHTSPPPFGITEVMTALAGVVVVAALVWRLWRWSHAGKPRAPQAGPQSAQFS